MSSAQLLPLSSPLGELLASDEIYFRLAADVHPLPACEMAAMPGFEHVPAGCVVQAVQAHQLPLDAAGWIRRVEYGVRSARASLARIYLTQPIPRLERVLEAEGYRARKELAFYAPVHGMRTDSLVRFHRVTTAEQWKERLAIHREDHANSDGYDTEPEGWCELVRRKCESGLKQSYLIEYDSQICGSVGAMPMPGLLRFKNLIIRPAFRRRGVGFETVCEVAQLAKSQGLPAIGAFGIEKEGGAELYTSAGFSVIGYQTEWCKPLVQEFLHD